MKDLTLGKEIMLFFCNIPLEHSWKEEKLTHIVLEGQGGQCSGFH